MKTTGLTPLECKNLISCGLFNAMVWLEDYDCDYIYIPDYTRKQVTELVRDKRNGTIINRNRGKVALSDNYTTRAVWTVENVTYGKK